MLTSDLSLDGSRMVYAQQRAGVDRTELWMVDLATDSRERLAEDLGGPIAGAVSPDGRQLAYTLRHERERGPQGAVLMLRSLEDGSERPLSQWIPDSAFIPTGWTSDGHAVLGSYLRPLAGGRGRLELWSALAKETPEPDSILLDEKGANIWQTRASPDGRWTAFVVHRESSLERLELGVAPFGPVASGAWRRILADHEWPDKPRWAPDGRALYFITRRPETYYNLWRVGFRYDDRDAGG